MDCSTKMVDEEVGHMSKIQVKRSEIVKNFIVFNEVKLKAPES